MTPEASISRKEFEGFRKMMLALSREDSGDLNVRSQRNISTTNVSWFTNDRELQEMLIAPSGDFGARVLRLRPPSGLDIQRTIVGMWCSWNFESATPHCKIQILIHRGGKNVYGFRIDPPFVYDKHQFWHVQFTHRFSNEETRFPESQATWISDRTPAFPIPLGDAANITPKDATVYAVISLYGADISAPIYDRIRQLTKGVHDSLKTLIPRPAPAN
jgi:hypothetical protein